MREINLSKLKNSNDLLDAKYGKQGTQSRDEFNKDAIAFYYGEFLREKRKELKLTQQNLAEISGLKREYIAKVEKGHTDIQISSFIKILRAMGLDLDVKEVRQCY